MSEDAPPPDAAFTLPQDGPDDPRPIVRRLVEEMEEFRDLRVGEAVIMAVFRTEPMVKAGRAVLGTMALPKFQGSNGPFAFWLLVKVCGGTPPDFILTLDAQFWGAATPMQREALVFHEMMHARHATDKEGELKFTDEGLPVWAIFGHDLEEFDATVRRYGAWLPDITRFVAAAREGGVR